MRKLESIYLHREDKSFIILLLFVCHGELLSLVGRELLVAERVKFSTSQVSVAQARVLFSFQLMHYTRRACTV